MGGGAAAGRGSGRPKPASDWGETSTPTPAEKEDNKTGGEDAWGNANESPKESKEESGSGPVESIEGVKEISSSQKICPARGDSD